MYGHGGRENTFVVSWRAITSRGGAKLSRS